MTGNKILVILGAFVAVSLSAQLYLNVFITRQSVLEGSESPAFEEHLSLSSESPGLGNDNNDSIFNDFNDCLLHIQLVRNIVVYSQNDEDGAMLQTLRCMGGHGTKEYFEFGSEDGKEVNTRILREHYGWKGHLLDGGNDRPSINLHREYFTPSNIVSILEKYSVSKRLDLLSIDCDFDDFYIMREILLAGYRPRVLITEYNRNFGPEWSVTAVAKNVGNELNEGWRYLGYSCYFGMSGEAAIKLAKAFGYTPVFSNGVNMIYVNIEDAKKLNLLIPQPENFPPPLEIELHGVCNDLEWNVVDDKAIDMATQKDKSHAEFAKSLSSVVLHHESVKRNSHNLSFRFFESVIPKPAGKRPFAPGWRNPWPRPR